MDQQQRGLWREREVEQTLSLWCYSSTNVLVGGHSYLVCWISSSLKQYVVARKPSSLPPRISKEILRNLVPFSTLLTSIVPSIASPSPFTCWWYNTSSAAAIHPALLQYIQRCCNTSSAAAIHPALLQYIQRCCNTSSAAAGYGRKETSSSPVEW